MREGREASEVGHAKPLRGAEAEARAGEPSARRFWAVGVLGAALLLLVHLAILLAAPARGPVEGASLALALASGWVLGALAADLATGLVHWACDTWGDEATPFLGRTLIYAFREHHRDPRAMLASHWIDCNREPATATALVLVLALLPPARAWLADHLVAHAFLVSLASYSAWANQLHCWAHAERAPGPVVWLQRRGLVLSPARHARHHRPPHLGGYCISTGWLNPALDVLGFWRGLERLTSRFTGAEPRGRIRGAKA